MDISFCPFTYSLPHHLCQSPIPHQPTLSWSPHSAFQTNTSHMSNSLYLCKQLYWFFHAHYLNWSFPLFPVRLLRFDVSFLCYIWSLFWSLVWTLVTFHSLIPLWALVFFIFYFYILYSTYTHPFHYESQAVMYLRELCVFKRLLLWIIQFLVTLGKIKLNESKWMMFCACQRASENIYFSSKCTHILLYVLYAFMWQINVMSFVMLYESQQK